MDNLIFDRTQADIAYAKALSGKIGSGTACYACYGGRRRGIIRAWMDVENGGVAKCEVR